MVSGVVNIDEITIGERPRRKTFDVQRARKAKARCQFISGEVAAAAVPLSLASTGAIAGNAAGISITLSRSNAAA